MLAAAAWLATTLSATRSYAIVIGNNAPPVDEPEIETLAYADDDAIRVAGLLFGFGSEVRILTVLDAPTQHRHLSVASATVPPTVVEVERAFAEVASELRAARGRGESTRVYVYFSGHGEQPADGPAYLALLDGRLDQSSLQRLLPGPELASAVHLIIDACHAGAVVGVRGTFPREAEAQRVSLSASEQFSVWQATVRAPHVGVIIATSATGEAHEWSAIEAGVFSYQLVSALTGAADVNSDGRIEYTEVEAFIASANRDLSDPRAHARVQALPPAIDLRAPLVVLEELTAGRRLVGNAGRLGHFFIELPGGERYMDAHLDSQPATIVVPTNDLAFVRTGDREAQLPIGNPLVEFDDLTLVPITAHARGSIETAYARGLFTSPFGPTYYRGYVDSAGEVSVPFEPASVPSAPAAASRMRRHMALGVLGVAATALATSGVSFVLAMRALNNYDQTTMQRPATEASAHYVRWGNRSLAAAGTTILLTAAAWLLWPPQAQ